MSASARIRVFIAFLALVPVAANSAGQNAATADRDARVRSFLERSRDQWHDLNVPYEDGQVLHDLIVNKHFTRALEIGTSTGHSGTWIAWAMSKTGGKLGRLNDEARHRTALQNFRDAGIDSFVDARLGNAHDLVRELPGPWDFVFSDADKDWYTQVPQGCGWQAGSGRMLHGPQRAGSVRRNCHVSGVRSRSAQLPDGDRPHQSIRHLDQLQATAMSRPHSLLRISDSLH